MCYTLIFPETQAMSYLNIVLKHMLAGLGNLICASDEPSELEQILSEI